MEKLNNIRQYDTILFYDGDCGFCNRSVQFVLKAEKAPVIFFCALQSSQAKDFLSKRSIEINYQTLYFFHGKVRERSSAVLAMLPFFKWYYQWMNILWIVPKPLRDGFYNVIAKRRHRFMKGFCLVLTTNQRQRFIGK